MKIMWTAVTTREYAIELTEAEVAELFTEHGIPAGADVTATLTQGKADGAFWDALAANADVLSEDFSEEDIDVDLDE